MTKKKKHHYIPRFYLKRFSANNEGKFIGLYNHKCKIFIQGAPLKHQACENFLYGEDDVIENALAEMENNVARMFYYWTEEKLLYPPPVESNGFKLLKRFILYQAYRTPKSGDDIMKSLNQGLKTVLKEFKPDLWYKMKDGILVHKNPVLMMLLHAIECEDLLNYLDCKFLVNLSELPFITSDSPVVFYNQLMEKAGSYVGATGLVMKGLQVFYPIHPRLLICLYDSSVYNFCDGRINCCSTESVEEIHQLNALQYINSNAQLFFDEFISEEYIKELCSENEKYRTASHQINRIIKQGTRKFLFTSSEDARIDLKLNFFKLKINPNDYKDRIAPSRHSSFVRPINKIDIS